MKRLARIWPLLLLPVLLGAGPGSCSKVEARNPNRFNPTATYALIVGILEWKDPSLLTFPKEGRKDLAFKETLLRRGVPQSQIIFLEDKQATSAEIRQSFQSLMDRAPQESTFIFYFAGHGDRIQEQTVLLSYDVNLNDALKTGITAQEIEVQLASHFHGDTVLLFGDYCHSGGLAKVAQNLAPKGIKAAALTSANEIAESTSAWTFTEGLIQLFEGASEIDREHQGSIRYKQAQEYIKREMMYRESQLYGEGHTPNFPLDFEFNKVVGAGASFQLGYWLGDYVQAAIKGDWKVGKIQSFNPSTEFFEVRLNDKNVVTLKNTEMRTPIFPEFQINEPVKVGCSSLTSFLAPYPAVISAREGKIYLVTPPLDTELTPKTWVPSECLHKVN